MFYDFLGDSTQTLLKEYYNPKESKYSIKTMKNEFKDNWKNGGEDIDTEVDTNTPEYQE
jgi:hypothetical protein